MWPHRGKPRQFRPHGGESRAHKDICRNKTVVLFYGTIVAPDERAWHDPVSKTISMRSDRIRQRMHIAPPATPTPPSPDQYPDRGDSPSRGGPGRRANRPGSRNGQHRRYMGNTYYEDTLAGNDACSRTKGGPRMTDAASDQHPEEALHNRLSGRWQSKVSTPLGREITPSISRPLFYAGRTHAALRYVIRRY